jgi:hypothetical protein
MKRLMGYDIEDVLELAGLQHRRSTLGIFLPALGLIAVGAAIGAGLGLAFAPAWARRLREDVGNRLGHLREEAKKEAHHYSEASANSAHR